MEIKDTFTNKHNQKFSLVKEYIYNGNEEDLGILRKTVITGMMIFQDFNNKNLGYKIHSCYKTFSLNGQEEMIQKLHEYGKNVTNTEFPYGVITYNHNVVGQVIPYYDDANTLGYELLNNKDVNPYTLFIKVYFAIKELYENGILYYDIHSKNVMLTNFGIRIIDFDNRNIQFSYPCEENEIAVVGNFISKLIAFSPFHLNIFSYMPNFRKIGNLEDLYEELCYAENKMDLKIRKKKNKKI